MSDRTQARKRRREYVAGRKLHRGTPNGRDCTPVGVASCQFARPARVGTLGAAPVRYTLCRSGTAPHYKENRSMFRIAGKLGIASLLFVAAGASALTHRIDVPAGYKGKPYTDATHPNVQKIPGRVEAAFFDSGGEGVAYHDIDAINHGSGELNHKPEHCEPGVSKPICLFREDEGMDISYVKKGADLNHPNMVTPDFQQLYIGW